MLRPLARVRPHGFIIDICAPIWQIRPLKADSERVCSTGSKQLGLRQSMSLCVTNSCFATLTVRSFSDKSRDFGFREKSCRRLIGITDPVAGP